jgi:hypothetical protein
VNQGDRLALELGNWCHFHKQSLGYTGLEAHFGGLLWWIARNSDYATLTKAVVLHRIPNRKL